MDKPSKDTRKDASPSINIEILKRINDIHYKSCVFQKEYDEYIKANRETNENQQRNYC